jgi:hypothetical protein
MNIENKLSIETKITGGQVLTNYLNIIIKREFAVSFELFEWSEEDKRILIQDHSNPVASKALAVFVLILQPLGVALWFYAEKEERHFDVKGQYVEALTLLSKINWNTLTITIQD